MLFRSSHRHRRQNQRGGREGTAGRYRQDHAESSHDRHSHAQRWRPCELASFPSGVKVIAHENNKKEQETSLAAGGRGAPPADHLPSQVVTKNKESLTIECVNLELYHWAPAHTSGDLVIYLPTEKIVFTGDIIAAQMADPFIHLEKNGSSEGWITTTKGIVALDSDQFVPGHGDIQTKAMVQKRLADAEAKRTKIMDLVAQGKSLLMRFEPQSIRRGAVTGLAVAGAGSQASPRWSTSNSRRSDGASTEERIGMTGGPAVQGLRIPAITGRALSNRRPARIQ